MNHTSAALVAGTLISTWMLSGIPADGQSQETSHASANWEGVWVSQADFGPDLKGPVDIHRIGDRWVARIQGENVPVDRKIDDDGSVAWSFSVFDQGRFIGQQSDIAAPIEGHWLQPPGPVQNYPFATPVRFTAAGDENFTGVIEPFPQTVTLNVPLAQGGEAGPGADNTYRTYLRNPERNLGVFFRIETASFVGEDIRFANEAGEILAEGTSIDPGERFTMVFPRFGTTFEFTRRSREAAPSFYPRRSPNMSTPLPRPVELDDGWPTDFPAKTGFDEAPLIDVLQEFAAFEPDGLREPYLHAILVAHKGKLIVEEYYHGFHRDRPHDSRSAGKSVGATLLGMAIHQGAIETVDDLVYPYFGGTDAFDNPDARKERMTLRHVVSMTQGFDCDDDDYDTPGNEDIMQSQSEEDDWYKYILDLPMVKEPGEQGAYCSGGINLLGGVVASATGTSLPQFFEDSFAKPLGISDYYMNLSPTYEGYMGGGIRLRPRDFMKMGQLYLNGGLWNGERLLSEEWVEATAAPQASINRPDDYSFGWWLETFEVEGEEIETYSARGNGGQMLFVAPSLDLVIMVNAANYSDGRTRRAWRDRLLIDGIFPGALAATTLVE
ncbi:MAG: serine hydrolase [Pseudomonadota bacterium]